MGLTNQSVAAPGEPLARRVALVLSVFAFALLSPAYLFFLSEALATVMAAHCAVGAVMLITAAGLSLSRCQAGPVLHAAAWVIMAGPLGSLIVIFAILLGGSRGPEKANFGAFVEHQLAPPPIDQAHDLARAIRDNRVRVSGALNVASFRDILAGHDQRAKLKTLSIMSREYRPEFAAALNLALHDDNAAVRVLGAGVLSRLQEQFSARIELLEARLRDQPGTADTLRALAAEHRAYAQSGLLSPERKHMEMERANQHLRACGDIEDGGGRLDLQQVPVERWQDAAHGDKPSNRRAAPPAPRDGGKVVVGKSPAEAVG